MLFPNINPTAFEILGIEIKWYGISYAVSLFLALFYSKFLANKYNNLNKEVFDDVLIWSALGIIFGGRLGYVIFYDLGYYLNNYKLILLGIRDGGMSFHGGIFGVTLACFIYSKFKKINFLALMDIIACSASIGLFLGRISNFINSELWGKKTDFFLGVIFPNGGPLPRHPSQLYEAFLEGLVLFFMINYIYRKKNHLYGFTSGYFLILYSVFRIFAENFREPDSHIGFIIEPYISLGIVLTFPLLLLGVYILIFYVKNNKNIKK